MNLTFGGCAPVQVDDNERMRSEEQNNGRRNARYSEGWQSKSGKHSDSEQRISPVAGEYTLVRSRRRTIALEVQPDATLVVRVPTRTPLWYVERTLEQKASWVQKKLAEARGRLPLLPRHAFLTGERFPYLGRDWPFVVTAFQAAPLMFDEAAGFSLDVSAFDRSEVLFASWYRARARAVITDRVAWYAPAMGVHPGRIRITGAERRWGSCSASGTLSFAWRLVMAPPEIIDYVVVHELAHLREMNHSERFWAVVAGAMPDYDARRRWLRDNGGLLSM
ncbi:MAG TPA: SprT family zinc-dependent metalloprotease [Candidatus Cryosericum sp.]|nr:SprT family zinc-dependent metalloprotease [Candidatus Cryosericum sp.]